MSNLNGKCLESFLKKYDFINEAYFDAHYGEVLQNALIVDFFDTHNIYIETEVTIGYCTHDDVLDLFDSHVNKEWVGTYMTRQEATNKAIQKACEIFNERNV
jgi:hypothetical protein